LGFTSLMFAPAPCPRLGAAVLADHGNAVNLATPAGMPFCVLARAGEQARQGPTTFGSGRTNTLVDQVTIDADPAVFDDELRFWVAITQWRPVASRVPGFVPLERPPNMSLRVMLQPRNSSDGATGCHLDFACDDMSAAIDARQQLGATPIARHAVGTVMADPSGASYCLTARRPATGTLGQP
jgi:hypothetical protein